MQKTKKAVSSRFRMNKKGKIKRWRPGKSHLMTGKSRSRKRHLRRGQMTSAVDQHRLRRFLPHG